MYADFNQESFQFFHLTLMKSNDGCKRERIKEKTSSASFETTERAKTRRTGLGVTISGKCLQTSQSREDNI